MPNPYQAPRETPATDLSMDLLTAEFHLTQRQIRFAESKFILRRCGRRLSLLSIVMAVLAIAVGFDLPPFPFLVLRTLLLMGITSAIYLWLIRDVRNDLRTQLRDHGIIDGAYLAVSGNQDTFRCITSTGEVSVAIAQSRLFATRQGAIIRIASNLFVFVPRHSTFSCGGYREFVREFLNRQRSHL